MRFKLQLLAVLFVILVASVWAPLFSPGLSISDIKYNSAETWQNTPENCIRSEVLTVSWLTSRPAICELSWCDGELCSWADPEPGYGLLHQYVIYDWQPWYTVTITCVDKRGNTAQETYQFGLSPPLY